MKRLKLLVATFALAITTLFFVPATVGAVNVLDDSCDVDPDSVLCTNQDENAGDIVGVVVNTLLFVVGLVAVIMIIYGAFRYTASGGDAGAIKAAKDTILYAVIGLVVAVAAFAIVNWVVKLF